MGMQQPLDELSSARANIWTFMTHSDGTCWLQRAVIEIMNNIEN